MIKSPSPTRMIIALKKPQVFYTTRRQVMMDEFEIKVEQDKNEQLAKRKVEGSIQDT